MPMEQSERESVPYVHERGGTHPRHAPKSSLALTSDTSTPHCLTSSSSLALSTSSGVLLSRSSSLLRLPLPPEALDMPNPDKLKLNLLVLRIMPSGPAPLPSCPNSLTLDEAVELPPIDVPAADEVEATVGNVPSLVLILRTRAPSVSRGGAVVVIVGTELELACGEGPRILPLLVEVREREGEGGEVSRSREFGPREEEEVSSPSIQEAIDRRASSRFT